jgi:hypothetical protein
VLIIFGLKREEVTGSWRRLHNKVHNLHFSSIMIRMIISRMIQWEGHIAHIKEMRNT